MLFSQRNPLPLPGNLQLPGSQVTQWVLFTVRISHAGLENYSSMITLQFAHLDQPNPSQVRAALITNWLHCQSTVPPPVTTAGVMLLSNPSHYFWLKSAGGQAIISYRPGASVTCYDSSLLRPHRYRFGLRPPFHVFWFSQPHSIPSAHLSHCRWNPTVTTRLRIVGNPLQAEHFGRLRRTGEASKPQRGGSAPAADICRERVSCKIRARPTLEPRPPDVWSGRIVKSGKHIALQSFL